MKTEKQKIDSEIETLESILKTFRGIQSVFPKKQNMGVTDLESVVRRLKKLKRSSNE